MCTHRVLLTISYLILDFYAGGDLYKYISSHGPLRPSVAADLFRQLIDGTSKVEQD